MISISKEEDHINSLLGNYIFKKIFENINPAALWGLVSHTCTSWNIIIKCLWDGNSSRYLLPLVFEAANLGYLSVLKYINEENTTFLQRPYMKSIKPQNMKRMTMIEKSYYILKVKSSYVCLIAARAGKLECLKYAHEIGCKWDSNTSFQAARGGHLDCLKYIFENGCEWDDYTLSSSSFLECLKYAQENGREWNYSTPSEAARLGQLECLKYAYEKDVSGMDLLLLEICT